MSNTNNTVSKRMSGGERAAFRMGMQHGANGQRRIDAEKSFGVFAAFYHKGYEQGQDAAAWHEAQRA